MRHLTQAVDAVIARNAPARQIAINELRGLVDDCESALQVWQGYLASPGAPGDHWTILSWIGPERVRRLHEINLGAKDRVRRLAEAAGPSVSRFAMLEADVIELAYRSLREGETGEDAARAAVGVMEKRIAELRGLVDRIEKAPAAKPQPEPRKKAAAETLPKALSPTPPAKKASRIAVKAAASRKAVARTGPKRPVIIKKKPTLLKKSVALVKKALKKKKKR